MTTDRLDPLLIADPCHEDWDRMRRDGGARHCARCDKHVIDLATLTPTELRGVARLTGGSFCGRQTIRDGALVLRSEPMKPRSPFAVRVVFGGALVAGALGAAACQPAVAAPPDPVVIVQVEPQPTPVQVPDVPVRPIEPPDSVLAGGIAMPPSWSAPPITFASRSARVTGQWSGALTELARGINAITWAPFIRIEGHLSGSESPRGELARARAEAVKAALVRRGVDAKRLVVRAGPRLDGASGQVSFTLCYSLDECR